MCGRCFRRVMANAAGQRDCVAADAGETMRVASFAGVDACLSHIPTEARRESSSMRCEVRKNRKSRKNKAFLPTFFVPHALHSRAPAG